MYICVYTYLCIYIYVNTFIYIPLRETNNQTITSNGVERPGHSRDATSVIWGEPVGNL